MEADDLVMRFGDRTVATVLVDGDRMGLVYDRDWLVYEHRFPISLSLPLGTETVVGGVAHAFLKNLLPEGQVREAVCQRLGISVDNDVALLRAIGGECAGALSVVNRTAVSSKSSPGSYRPLDAKQLAAMVSREQVPLLIAGPPTRLSLAGAQDKVPVALIDDRMHLPIAGAASTHILKLPHARFPHVPLNEMFVMGLAQRIGIDSARADLVLATDPPSLLVERYDRQRSGNRVVRLHQEDLCQAIGLPPSSKYEQEGGPTLVSAIAIVRDHTRQPLVDVRRLVEWQAFNVVVGNCDGHGKNLSFLYAGRELDLAPFYDLMSTRAYTALDRRLAMSVGGRRDPNELHRSHWEAFAREAGLGPRVVVDIVSNVAERVLGDLPAWTAVYRERFGQRPVLETLPTSIRRSAQRLSRQMK